MKIYGYKNLHFNIVYVLALLTSISPCVINVHNKMVLQPSKTYTNEHS